MEKELVGPKHWDKGRTEAMQSLILLVYFTLRQSIQKSFFRDEQFPSIDKFE